MFRRFRLPDPSWELALIFGKRPVNLCSRLFQRITISNEGGYKIDAIVFTVGHPAGTIKEATTSCEAKLISVNNDKIKELAEGADYYSMTTIPGGMYTGTPDDVETFGVGATFVSSSKTSPEVVYEIVKSVFENFPRFKKMHPAFGNLNEADMIKNNLSAPLHEGAVKYYKEKGWM